MRRILAAGALAALMCASELCGEARASDHFAVRRVFDGDTIDVAGRGRVRLLGIDAPETGAGFDTSQPFAAESRAHLASLVLHRFVHLEADGDARDKYGRVLAYVLRDDGVFVNGEMLRAGLATVSARLPLRRLGELRRAEAAAQQAKRGMWGGRPVIPLRPRAMQTGPRRSRSSSSVSVTGPSEGGDYDCRSWSYVVSGFSRTSVPLGSAASNPARTAVNPPPPDR